MGNSQTSTNGSLEDEGTDSRRTLKKASSRSMRNFGAESKAAPLVILRDQSCQTGSNSAFGDITMRSFSCTRIFLILSFIYAFIIALLMIFSFAQGIMIYLNIIRFPLGDLTNLDRFNLQYTRNIQTKTEDGYILKGYHMLPITAILTKNLTQPLNNAVFDQLLQEADRVIIYFHGNAATRAAPIRLRCLKQLAVYFNAHIVTFDYRGFGDSQGWPTEVGTYRDGRAMISWLHNITGQQQAAADMTAAVVNINAANSKPKPTAQGGGLLSLSSFFGGNGKPAAVVTAPPAATAAATTVPVTAGTNNSSLHTSNPTTKKKCYPHLFLYGQSLGSGIATEMAVVMSAMDPSLVSGLILDAPFTSIRSGVSTHPLGAVFRIFPVVKNLLLWALRFQYNNIVKIIHANTPILFLHGARDHKIPSYNSHQMQQALLTSGRYQAVDFRTHELSDACGNETCQQIPSQYVLLPTADHNSVHEAPEYIEAMEAFLTGAEQFTFSRNKQ